MMRDITFIDVETTGLAPACYELLEIAAVRVHPQTLEVIAQASYRVRPERIAQADPRALEVNGYTAEAWRDAFTRREGLMHIARLLEGATLAGHNVSFDVAFLRAGYESEGLHMPDADYHTLDTVSLAWPLLLSGEVESLSLTPVCAALGIARPEPHRALADALASLEVARRMLKRSAPGGV